MSEQSEVVVQDRMTINDIAAVTDRNAKTLRAYLRKHFTRSEELKNSRWGDAKNAQLTKTQTSSLLNHFTRNEETEEQEQAS